MGEKKIKRYYFIDMENVHREGLKGISKLTSKDHVRIYYSNPLETIPMNVHIEIMKSEAQFEYITVDVHIKNAADCMILFDLKEIAKEHKKAEFFIVSNDTDFDRPISDFAAKKMNVRKVRVIDGEEDLKKEAEIRSFIEEHFDDIAITGDRADIISRTVDAVMRGKTRSQVNYNLLKIYDSQSVKLIYNELKPLMKNMPGK